MSKCLKVLFLSYYFPPAPFIGCVRTWSIAKGLSRLGYEVTVVTPQPDTWLNADNPPKVVEDCKKEGIKLLYTKHYLPQLIPGSVKSRRDFIGKVWSKVCREIAKKQHKDPYIGWYRAVEEACAHIKPEEVDVILATGSPFFSYDLAKKLSVRLKKPYVLDYRDPWTTDPHNVVYQEEFEMEKDVISTTSAVMIVSPSWAEDKDKQHNLGNRLHVVMNGFDPETLPKIQPTDFGHFAIVYAGTFYLPKRIITPITAAMQKLKERKCPHPVFLHYYGSSPEHVLEEAERFGVSDQIVIHGRVSRTEVYSAYRGAGTVAVISTVDAVGSVADKGILTGKMYELIGLQVPFLLVAPQESDIAIVAKNTGLGTRFSGNEIDKIADHLMEAMNGWKPEIKNTEEYSWVNLTQKVANILQDAVDTYKPN